MPTFNEVMKSPDRTITMRCCATEFGVTDVTFESAIQIRVFGPYIEIWSIAADPVESIESPEMLGSLDEEYSWHLVARWICDNVEPLGRDYRDRSVISGEEGVGAEMLLMAWMDNTWDLEDRTDYPEDPGERVSVQDVVKCLVWFDEHDIERLYHELSGFRPIDNRLFEMVEIIEEVRELPTGRLGPGLCVSDFDPDSDLLEQMLSRVRHWRSECVEHAEKVKKAWKRFDLDKGGRVTRYMTTDGIDCVFSATAPGGANHTTDSNEAQQRVTPYVNKTLLSDMQRATG